MLDGHPLAMQIAIPPVKEVPAAAVVSEMARLIASEAGRRRGRARGRADGGDGVFVLADVAAEPGRICRSCRCSSGGSCWTCCRT